MSAEPSLTDTIAEEFTKNIKILANEKLQELSGYIAGGLVLLFVYGVDPQEAMLCAKEQWPDFLEEAPEDEK